jgi:hypothetical protein
MPDFDNFAITATGRSGTKFLSYNMNRSNIWTVKHEPRSVDVQERFARNKYGEVNGRLLDSSFSKLVVAKKAVILRRPADVLVSFENRTVPGSKHMRDKLPVIRQLWYTLDELIKEGIPIIWFHKMVSDLAYLKHVFGYFGITDVKLTVQIQQKKINVAKKKRRVRDIAQCSQPVLSMYDNHAKWFEEQYFGKDIPKNAGCV